MTHHPQTQPHHLYYRGVVLGVASLIRGVVNRFIFIPEAVLEPIYIFIFHFMIELANYNYKLLFS